jgi:Flp pilus assembly protein TadG
VLFVVLLAVLVGIWAFTQMGGAEMNKDNAVAEAADQVGAAAENIGDAAKDAGQAAENAADRVTGQ